MNKVLFRKINDYCIKTKAQIQRETEALIKSFEAELEYGALIQEKDQDGVTYFRTAKMLEFFKIYIPRYKEKKKNTEEFIKWLKLKKLSAKEIRERVPKVNNELVVLDFKKSIVENIQKYISSSGYKMFIDNPNEILDPLYHHRTQIGITDEEFLDLIKELLGNNINLLLQNKKLLKEKTSSKNDKNYWNVELYKSLSKIIDRTGKIKYYESPAIFREILSELLLSSYNDNNPVFDYIYNQITKYEQELIQFRVDEMNKKPKVDTSNIERKIEKKEYHNKLEAIKELSEFYCDGYFIKKPVDMLRFNNLLITAGYSVQEINDILKKLYDLIDEQELEIKFKKVLTEEQYIKYKQIKEKEHDDSIQFLISEIEAAINILNGKISQDDAESIYKYIDESFILINNLQSKNKKTLENN